MQKCIVTILVLGQKEVVATEARGWSYVSAPAKGMERSEKGLPREVNTQANNCLSQVTASMESSVSSVRDTGLSELMPAGQIGPMAQGQIKTGRKREESRRGR